MTKKNPAFRLPPFTRHREFAAKEAKAKQAQWWITDYEIHNAWNEGLTGEGQVIGIADTGVDREHLAAGGELEDRIVARKSFVNGDWDENGHGTHCASIAVGAPNNRGGIGVAHGAKVAMAQVLDGSGSGSLRSVIAGLEWLASIGVDVISLSIGTASDNRDLRRTIQGIADSGIPIVAAAGNGSDDGVDFPGAYPWTLGIGAIDEFLGLAPFSDQGKEVDLVAPGVRILGAVLGGRYASLSGTSMATPWIASAIALRRQALAEAGKPLEDTDRLRDALDVSTVDLGDPGKDRAFGRGILDVPVWLDVEDDDESSDSEESSDTDHDDSDDRDTITGVVFEPSGLAIALPDNQPKIRKISYKRKGQ